MPTVSRGFYRWLFLRGASLEDMADRLNHIWTVGLLLILACIISWKQGANKPIHCWCPQEFSKGMVDYTESQCWNNHHIVYPRDVEKAMIALNITEPILLMNTQNKPLPYLMADGDIIDEEGNMLPQMATTVTLFQWLPLILIFQALLFKLPNLLMYILHGYSGLNFDKISGLTEGYENLSMNDRHVIGRQTGRYLYNWCNQCNVLPWQLLTLVWFFVKLLYFINVVVQTVILNTYLRTHDPPLDNSTSYGDVISTNIHENNASLWRQSPNFPRKAMCTFEIPMFQRIQKWSVVCQLPVNEFNETVYMFLWVWMVLVALVTCVSFVVWIFRTLIPIFRKRYVTKLLSLSDDINMAAVPQLELDKFMNLIGEDGVMALKLIGANSSEHMARDVVWPMWQTKVADRPAYSCTAPPSGTTHGVPAGVPGDGTSKEKGNLENV